MAIFIYNQFPYSWIPNGTNIRKIGYLTAEKLESLMKENGVITDVDKLTVNVLRLFTGILISERHGELRKLKNGDIIVVIDIDECLLYAFEVND